MDIRLRAEEAERRFLSPYACLSSMSRGRVRPEEECTVRTAFQRDRDRIIHSKSFRRLKYKTQVFTIPEGDHYRTRLTHTLEVAQIARTVARALRLNEDLTEAIALGHDLGHTPFGHAGEEALNEVFEQGFKHNEQSLRVVDILEGRKGLNLTWEVRDGILNHTGPVRPATLEGQIVKIADRVAYINHDIDDAIRGGVLAAEQLPEECLDVLGREHRERINTMVLDLIYTNINEPSEIKMSPVVQAATDRLREFLFRHVYIGSEAKREESKARHVVQRLFRYFKDNPHALPGEYLERARAGDVSRAACDYIAGMTDRFAIRVYQKLFLPLPWVD
ncbi:MAG: deoxyguanosinetriphosphate triphosphohydrolase [Pelotomaculum sp.]|uniref:Deoxyguanosinetriphosphate triphosphohydrolase-like protein n=1 Tax=Pelotomaculum thermopropionicum (strain DSM 13744 / JCM 10971 / SI) TaxID=370438 RepID=A5D3U4_PELTS|nr:deoxyguanosinetriphosphate triphosphohydrolase [Pelotomaculum sp.]BAF59086.1 dGTP triphosphohydrolase [Pelotomaculum thermopropionicum SI]